jgi:hypothetical protein
MVFKLENEVFEKDFKHYKDALDQVIWTFKEWGEAKCNQCLKNLSTSSPFFYDPNYSTICAKVYWFDD